MVTRKSGFFKRFEILRNKGLVRNDKEEFGFDESRCQNEEAECLPKAQKKEEALIHHKRSQ